MTKATDSQKAVNTTHFLKLATCQCEMERKITVVRWEEGESWKN